MYLSQCCLLLLLLPLLSDHFCLQVLWFFAGLADVAEPAAAALSRGRLLLPLTAGVFNAALRGSAAPLAVAEWRAATVACSNLQQEQRTLNMFWQVRQWV
jgi:hypothetical protein